MKKLKHLKKWFLCFIEKMITIKYMSISSLSWKYQYSANVLKWLIVPFSPNSPINDVFCFIDVITELLFELIYIKGVISEVLTWLLLSTGKIHSFKILCNNGYDWLSRTAVTVRKFEYKLRTKYISISSVPGPGNVLVTFSLKTLIASQSI